MAQRYVLPGDQPVQSSELQSYSPLIEPNLGNATSAGTLSPVTLAFGGDYSGDNGSSRTPSPRGTQGSSAFLLGHAALTNGTASFTLGGVPRGTYNLYLYGANYEGDRGAVFTVSSGTALGGFTNATNANTGDAGTFSAFVLGTNYVEFIGVTPDANGNINGTWGRSPTRSAA